MKNLNRYIQEKYLIDNNTHLIDTIEKYNDLFAKYPDLKEDRKNSKNTIKIILCTENIFDSYKRFFDISYDKYFTLSDILSKLTKTYKIAKTSLTAFSGEIWYNIIVNTQSNLGCFELLFHKEKPIIKLYLQEDNIAYLIDAARIIDFVLSHSYE